MSLDRRLVVLSGLLLVTGCGRAAPAAVASPSPTAYAASAEVEAVSLGSPTSRADAGIRACAVRKYANQVQGIGILSRARLLPEYVPLTGREPEIQSDEPVFVVQFAGTIRLPLRAGPGTAAYEDVENATCALLGGWPTWYVTGPWVDSLGNRGTPEPAPLMDKSLPPPLP